MKENKKIYDVCMPPFDIYGLILPETEKEGFHRIPDKIAKNISEGVDFLQKKTAGGRVRFTTNSSYVGIYATMGDVVRMSHMPLAGTAGFDLYKTVNGIEKYVCTFIPPQNIEEEKEFFSEIDLNESVMNEYTLNFPLYSDVTKLYIVLDKEAEVKKGKRYNNDFPVVYYGSSITQGACASRPGNCYENIISREQNIDYINLGFSGRAKAEVTMAEYISELNMSIFVCDYDHNAPDLEYLINTHERFINIIRRKQKELPIICISKPFCRTTEDYKRRDVIRENVKKAQVAGDNNIYFLDGNTFKEYLNVGDSMMVDINHPSDLGFYCMAKLIGEKVREIFSQQTIKGV